jgi:hypothetical protein
MGTMLIVFAQCSILPFICSSQQHFLSNSLNKLISATKFTESYVVIIPFQKSIPFNIHLFLCLREVQLRRSPFNRIKANNVTIFETLMMISRGRIVAII